MACIFCLIIAGAEPAHLVWNDSETLAFLDIFPASPGHTLVVPKTHAEDIWSIDPDAFAAVARTTRAVCELIDQRLGPDGLTLFQANRSAGWQDVFHLHVHVVPRYENDGLVQPWKDAPYGGSQLDAIGDRLGADKQR